MTQKEKDHLRRTSPFAGDQASLARAAEESAKATPQEKKADWEAKRRSQQK